ncbi:MAG: HAMP domain-containing sensor histidine kinase [Actinomycetota bacterium]|nr:HAMP domain-containing sensor histidine kinase [Actinomycetota bacterium]
MTHDGGSRAPNRRRVKSIRSRVLSVLFLTGAIGIVVSFALATQLTRLSQRTDLKQTSQAIATAVLQLVKDNASQQAIDNATAEAKGFYVAVYSNGKKIYSTSDLGKLNGQVTATKTTSDGKYSVFVVAPHANPTPVSAELTAISAVVIIGVLIGAFWATSIIAREIGNSVEATTKVVTRIESGDLSARIDSALPPEFDRLASAFDNMAKALEEGDIEQRRFLSDLAHEIATPISAVSGLAIAIADHIIDDQDEIEEASTLISSETKRIRLLLDDLRSLNQLEFLDTVSTEDFSALELARSLYGRFINSAREKAIKIEIDADETQIHQDRRLIEMVLNNFMTNAIRYSNNDSTVTIKGSSQSDEMYRVTVTDQGIGIKEEELTKIFERLYRVDEARDRERGGSGLGLAIARRASLNIGGYIEVESTYQQGSSFSLIFPKSSEDLGRSSNLQG